MREFSDMHNTSNDHTRNVMLTDAFFKFFKKMMVIERIERKFF